MSTTTLEASGTKAQADDASQFLTFRLAGEEYGLDILTVQEIRGFVPSTRLPNSPEHVTGVLNLRGTIVPLYDLRKMFQLPEIEYDQFAAIVVVTIGTRVIGLVVDRVSEVITASTGDIQPSPNVGAAADQICIRGILRHEEHLVILLDAVSLLKNDDLDLALAA
ncbi:MAG: chemotaxis protein CheW [Capsulimonadaceae bacterium]|nr:chemotaxis protein CheW [Capsulimonadaceae bacterium]